MQVRLTRARLQGRPIRRIALSSSVPLQKLERSGGRGQIQSILEAQVPEREIAIYLLPRPIAASGKASETLPSGSGEPVAGVQRNLRGK